MRGGWVSLLGVTLLCAAGAAWAAGDGPTTAQQAETWGEQLGGLVAQAAGVSFKEGKVPTVRLATAKEAGARLEAEFAAYLPAALHEELPEPEALGGQFLARYLFSHRGIVLVPENLAALPGASGLDPLQRAGILKLVLTQALTLALLDQQAPLAAAYYAPGGSDAALAHRAIWEGVQRLVQDAVAKELGLDERVRALARWNGFAIQTPVAGMGEDFWRAQRIRMASADRLGEAGARFVAAVREAKGAEGLLEALRKPPRYTSQILVPRDYISGSAAVPKDELLQATLADAVADYFQPPEWVNESHSVGALSLERADAWARWQDGGGPRAELTRSFDYDYLCGQSLIGNRNSKDVPAQRAASLHVFRSPEAAARFLRFRQTAVREDWNRLAEQRFTVERQSVVGGKDLIFPKPQAGWPDQGLAMLLSFNSGPRSKTAQSNQYFFLKGTWVLDLDLDVEPDAEALGRVVQAFVNGYTKHAGE